MHTLMNPRRLAMVAAVLLGTIAGSWSTPSPGAPEASGLNAARQCSNTLCPNWLWLRAPVLRVRPR